MKYKAKIDWWIALLLHGSNVLMVAILFIEPSSETWIYFLIVIPFVIFILWILMGSYYQLNDEELYIKIGPIFSRIKYDKIKSLELKTNFLSSMALTSKRIEIREHNKSYIRGTTFIGPVNREEFIEELKHRCKNLDSKNKVEPFDL